MLPRPSTTISFAFCSARVTIDPSGSWRRSLSPVTSSLPSGSQSMEYPISLWPLAEATSRLPSRPTATTCRSIQLQNHSLPSCHRGDSGIPRPLSRSFGSYMTAPLLVGLGRPQVGSSTYYTNDSLPDRQGQLNLACISLALFVVVRPPCPTVAPRSSCSDHPQRGPRRRCYRFATRSSQLTRLRPPA